MLPVVAEWADHWNVQTPMTPRQYERKLHILERLCEKIGRDPKTIRRSLWAGAIVGEDERDFARAVGELKPRHRSYLQSRIAGSPGQCIETIRRYVALGVTTFVLYFTINELRSLAVFARDVMPAFRKNPL
jgi:alkanesulfonate monooxygenase SsuD/methylene tetrahydromethanopterin reductase-like flavin-dependent oxidoreductase (luciferase family)